MKFLKTLGRKGLSAQALISRGDAARDARDWVSAASAYRTALETNPDLSGIWVQYGHVLKENGQTDEAVVAYRKALKRRPDDVETQVHLAHALKRIGLNEEAVEAFEKALALDPSDQASAEELFSLQKRLGLVPEAQSPEKATVEDEGAVVTSPDQETQAALMKERQANAANELRLSALQALNEEIRAENDILKEQVRGQQAEIEERHARAAAEREAAIAARDEFRAEVEALKQTLENNQAEVEALKKERNEAVRKIEALRARIQEYDVRTDLAKKEFLRSEGQIALIKNMILHEGEL